MRITTIAVLAACITTCAGMQHGAAAMVSGRKPAQLGPRPKFLVDDMKNSPLKTELQTCLQNTKEYFPHDFSIGHRGACMQFPEHTEESYIAAMEMGAGIVECDVAVTKDGQLVCRHDQCDLHTSTNILKTPLASKCKRTWEQRNVSAKLEVQCCTSDLTLEEFKTLKGRMDSWNAGGDTVDKVMDGTAKWRTTLYEHGKLVTHKESVELIKKWGRKATPELKKYTQGSGMPSYDEIRDKVVQDFKDVGFNASHVWLQSFELADIKYWIKKHPDFGKQAVYLDDAYCDGTKTDCEKVVPGVKGRTDGDGGEGSPFAVPDISFAKLKEAGVNFIAPPMQVLLKADGDKYAPSEYAMEAKKAGLKIITWTLERSANLAAAPTAAPERSGGGGWYYGTVNAISDNEGDVFEMLHVLAKGVQIEGIFSDWPATTTFYANCMLGSAYKRSCSNAPTYPAKLDPRPRYLVDDMTSSDLKTKLKRCIEDENVLYAPHDFSIGHRGACMQFPEHTEESYIAAMEMGAGIVECDVAVTKDGQLVCRHDQCDLHTSTNILKTALASKCKRTWEQRNVSAKLEVQCCTSDLTLEEFKTLKGRMDSWNAGGDTVDKVMDGTAKWRTTLYEHGKLVTHKESVELIKKWGRKATPELKKYTQGSGMPSYDEIRDKVVQDFKDVGFNASHVWLQSFELADIKYWIKKHPDFGKQAVYLDDAYCDGTKADCEKVVPGVKGRTDGDGGEGSPFAVPDISFAKLKEAGVNFIAPPMQVLLKADGDKYAPSEYAMEAKKAGLKIITWTLERSANLAAAPTAAPERSGGGGWYYGTVNAITNNEGDVFEMLHVLDKDVQIEGIFSDWPATTSFYANCIKKPITCQKADLTLSPASRTTVSFIVRLFAALTLFAFALTWH